MSGRKFIGIFAFGGFVIGMALGNSPYGGFTDAMLFKVGQGIPFGLIGAALGGAIQYFFRSGK